MPTHTHTHAHIHTQCLNRTVQKKNRKYPPSHVEVQCVIRRSVDNFATMVHFKNDVCCCRRPIHERFYFMDGQFRALEFDAAATTEEVNDDRAA